MRFRPCIDIHNGKVKQIVGSSLEDRGDSASENFVSERGADFYARMYKELGLSGGHIILLNPQGSPFYEMTRQQGILALKATPVPHLLLEPAAPVSGGQALWGDLLRELSAEHGSAPVPS